MSLEEGEEEAAAFSLQVQFLHMMEHPHDDVDDDMELDDEDDEEALMAMTMQQMLERGCDPHRLLQTDIEQLRRLLQAGLNPDLCLDDSMTSFLAHAAMAGHDDIVSLLLSYSANLESKNIFGNTPLQMMCKEHSGKANIIKTLLDFGADMNSVDMVSCIYLCLSIK